MARMRYVVTGGTGFIGRRVVSRILSRASDGRAERGVGAGASRVPRAIRAPRRRVGRTGQTTGRRPDRGRPRAHRRGTGRARRRRPRGALRGDLRHHRRRGRPAGRQRRRHPRGDRPRRPARRDAAPRLVDRGGGHLSRRVHRGGLRRRAGPPDAVSPDQVRGRDAGAVDAGAALPGLPARRGRRRLAHRRDGQDRRAVLLLRVAGQAGAAAARSPRSCCRTPAAPTSCRSTTWSKRSSN